MSLDICVSNIICKTVNAMLTLLKHLMNVNVILNHVTLGIINYFNRGALDIEIVALGIEYRYCLIILMIMITYTKL